MERALLFEVMNKPYYSKRRDKIQSGKELFYKIEDPSKKTFLKSKKLYKNQG